MTVLVTTNRGFTKTPTDSPDYNARVAGRNADQDVLDQALGLKAFAANGAIDIKEGTALLSKAGVAAMTLAAPTAGAPSAGGDDGKYLRIVSGSANAHTVTQTAPGFNNAGASKDVATFGGAVGDNLTLVAWNGEWIVISSVNVTLA